MPDAIFFDRDGVLNRLVFRNGYWLSPQKFAEFDLILESKEALSLSKEMGFLNIVVSNQPDITRGSMHYSELNKMTEHMRQSLILDDVVYCVHDDKNDSGCRKPAPGMIHSSQKKWNINLSRSFMVGDTWKDIIAAERSGITPILIAADYNKGVATQNRVNSILEAVDLVRQLSLKGMN